MPVYSIDKLTEELVTPKHSTALGQLVTGEQIEVGVLRFKAGEGAKEHAHPHEQVIFVLSGKIKMEIGGKLHVLGPRDIAHMPPNVPRKLDCLEDAELVSAKGIVGGVGHRI